MPMARPSHDDLASAVTLVERLRRAGICQRCGHEEVTLHGVAPDVFGRPTLICVLRPNPTMVSSSGGGGSKKHWGGPGGCRSTALHVDCEPDLGYAVVGHSLYGEPLTSFQVFEMPWCSRCTSTGWNMRNYASTDLERELGRPPTAEEAWEAFGSNLRDRAIEDHKHYLRKRMQD
jgi:hypothetical protein